MQQKIKTSDDYKQLENCPYCSGKIVKRGIRKKKYESIQRYYCKNCKKSLTAAITKHKTYPLRIIIDSITLNRQTNPSKTPNNLQF